MPDDDFGLPVGTSRLCSQEFPRLNFDRSRPQARITARFFLLSPFPARPFPESVIGKPGRFLNLRYTL